MLGATTRWRETATTVLEGWRKRQHARRPPNRGAMPQDGARGDGHGGGVRLSLLSGFALWHGDDRVPLPMSSQRLLAFRSSNATPQKRGRIRASRKPDRVHIIDWEMSFLPGLMTAAELLEIENGQIVKGELIYDAEELRKAMAQMAS
jgi:hypothetical protein